MDALISTTHLNVAMFNIISDTFVTEILCRFLFSPRTFVFFSFGFPFYILHLEIFGRSKENLNIQIIISWMNEQIVIKNDVSEECLIPRPLPISRFVFPDSIHWLRRTRKM